MGAGQEERSPGKKSFSGNIKTRQHEFDTGRRLWPVGTSSRRPTLLGFGLERRPHWEQSAQTPVRRGQPPLRPPLALGQLLILYPTQTSFSPRRADQSLDLCCQSSGWKCYPAWIHAGHGTVA